VKEEDLERQTVERGADHAVLKENEAGAKVDDLCRRHTISTATFYALRGKYGGMDASKAKRLRERESENAKLKRIVADEMLDMSAMKELLAINELSPWRSAKLWVLC